MLFFKLNGPLMAQNFYINTNDYCNRHSVTETGCLVFRHLYFTDDTTVKGVLFSKFVSLDFLSLYNNNKKQKVKKIIKSNGKKIPLYCCNVDVLVWRRHTQTPLRVVAVR